MGRAPCCDKANVKKGPWSPEEDEQLKEYIDKHGTGGNWIALPQKAGLRRCGKSCRLRWLNYLRPNIKHGEFSDDEDRIICSLFARMGSRFQSYFNIDDGNDDQKFLTSAPDEKGENGNCFSEINPLDYSIEEIKQLISTNNICNNMDFFHVDEIKKEETDYLYY
ncbi:hypothetical protein DH2020_017985 [Rehmannia glutinosa]|uniref:R2R3-MYB protein n=1 Tax=Rehmannia glutinosa TaxID=99300 RepID=A0ABR0WHN3_REHGL